MPRTPRRYRRFAGQRAFGCLVQTSIAMAMIVAATGCGTTRTSSTARTATEQLLVSDAIDRAVGQVNFRALAGQAVYLEDEALNTVVDRQYLSSSLRQHLLASGCTLREHRTDAEFIIEARAGVIGTDNHNLLFGIPAMQVPQFLPLQGVVPSAIPEVPFAKRQEQRGLAKVAVFAYHRETGMPVWQSGMAMSESTSKNFWVLGAGPFQKGTIFNGTNFAGAEIKNPLVMDRSDDTDQKRVALGQEASFASPLLFAASPETEAPATTPATNIPPPQMATKPGSGAKQ